MKRTVAIVLLFVLFGSIMVGCTEDKAPISQAEAVAIAMKDMGIDESDGASIHVHEGNLKNQPVFNVYISLADVDKQYVIAVNGGEILGILNNAGHSH